MKKRRKLRVLLLLAIGLLVPACIQTCESTPSDGVLTTGLRGDFRAISGPDGSTNVTGELRVGGQLSNVYLELVGDDVLQVTRGRKTQKMIRRSEPFGMVRYVANLNGNSAGKDVMVGFQRAVDKGAPASKVNMPPAFELVSPTNGQSLSRAKDEVVIRWKSTSSTDPMTVTLAGSCIESISRTVEVDGGSLVLPPGTLRSNMPSGMQQMQPVEQGSGAGQGAPVPVAAAQNCRISVKATRTRRGRVDPGYGQGGSIIAEQYREVGFNSVP